MERLKFSLMIDGFIVRGTLVITKIVIVRYCYLQDWFTIDLLLALRSSSFMMVEKLEKLLDRQLLCLLLSVQPTAKPQFLDR